MSLSKRNLRRHEQSCRTRVMLQLEERNAEATSLRAENEVLSLEVRRLRELLHKNPPKRRTIKPQTKTKLILKQRGLCNICSTQLTDNLWDIDHRVRWADSFNDDEDNLQVLCLPCHRAKTTQECSAATS